jgi:hypothetical protein
LTTFITVGSQERDNVVCVLFQVRPIGAVA